MLFCFSINDMKLRIYTNYVLNYFLKYSIIDEKVSKTNHQTYYLTAQQCRQIKALLPRKKTERLTAKNNPKFVDAVLYGYPAGIL